MWRLAILLLVLLACNPATGEKQSRAGCSEKEERSVVSLVKKEDRREIVSTEYGQISAVDIDDPVAKRLGRSVKYHLQFISLDPNSLFLPVLLHADMVFYVHSGSGKLTYTEEGEKGTKKVKLERGDVFRLKSGCIFYIRSSLKTQRERLRINAMFSNNAGDQGPPPQEQWVGAYSSIQDLVQGFDKRILEAAFQAPEEVIEEITNSTRTPPIIHAGSSSKEKEKDENDDDHTLWTTKEATLNYMKRAVLYDFEATEDSGNKKKKKKTKSTDTFNFFDEDPDVENCNGWSTMVTENNLRSLKGSNIGVFMVNLTAGSMMGPHWNPSAVEIGVVVEGEGMVMAVSGMTGSSECNNNTRVLVEEGDVFVVPRFHPMAQMSFNNGTLVFMGFSTSNKYNHPQFLAGKASVLQVLKKAVLEAAFNVDETTLGKLLDAQEELTILECLSCAEDEKRVMEEEIEEVRREKEERRREEEKRKREEAAQKRREEEKEKRRQEEEARQRQEEEEEKRRQEEEARRRQQEEEEERRRQEEEEEARRRQQEEEEQRRQEEEAAAKRQQQEEEKQRRRQEEEEARRQEEAEARRQQQEEEEQRRRQEEEAAAKRQQKEEKEERRRQEEQRRQEEEEERRRQEEQRRQEEEEARRRQEEQRRQEEEEGRPEREPEEETEEEIARREEEERQRAWEEARRERSRRRRPSHEETEEEFPPAWEEPTRERTAWGRRWPYEETEEEPMGERTAGGRRWPYEETEEEYPPAWEQPPEERTGWGSRWPYEETEEQFPPTREEEEWWDEPRRRVTPYYAEEESEEQVARRLEEERQRGQILVKPTHKKQATSTIQLS